MRKICRISVDYLPGAWLIPALLFLLLSCEKEALANLGTGDTIKIGLLIPDNRSVAARQAAELAIIKANSKGGIRGSVLKLVVKSMEGPWGTGSTQAVNLIFQDNVVALIGSHDGRNAHLVEQVSAKSRVVFLSAWSGDPSLAQAFVPWFFNSVHNDISQADALCDAIYDRKKFGKISVISDTTYDSGSALKYFLRKEEIRGGTKPLVLSYSDKRNILEELISKIKASGTECVVVLVQAPASLALIKLLKMSNLDLPVYCPGSLLDENRLSHEQMRDYGSTLFAASLDLSSGKGKMFSDDYLKMFGSPPGAVAAYAYDAVNLLIEALEKGGTEREELQRALTAITYEGVTGNIQFDARGNRKGTAGFTVIKNGIPVAVK